MADQSSGTESDWYRVDNLETVPSPALLVYPDRILENVRRMIRQVGDDPLRLRPHVKTNKMPAVVSLMLEEGIRKFKCATIAEMEMCAQCGARDVLLAFQPVGPNVGRVFQMIEKFPQTTFSVIVDHESAVAELNEAACEAGVRLEVLLDIDCGQHRTGMAPGPGAVALYEAITHSSHLDPRGLHVYDGHLHEADPGERESKCEQCFAPVLAMTEELAQKNLPVPHLIVGGTPTFPFHARRPKVECSPGTSVLWDSGYGTQMTDLDFLYAALVLTRVVSKPAEDLLCLDLGHKSIASENPHPRVIFPQLPNAQAVSHSEEHLVLQTPQARHIALGTAFYGIPWHICPTVALHDQAYPVRNQKADAPWPVSARERILTI